MTNYLNTIYPKSNKINGVHYYILLKGHGIHRAETFDDMETIVNQAKWHNQTIKTAVIMQYGLPTEFIPETRQERFDREEGREHCKSIALDIDDYCEGRVFKCPECGELFTVSDDREKHLCSCGYIDDIDEFYPQSIYDYLEDVYDIEYRIGSDKELRSVQIMVACGGPNIYLDTASKNVELYWWNDRADFPLSSNAVANIDEWAEELYNC